MVGKGAGRVNSALPKACAQSALTDEAQRNDSLFRAPLTLRAGPRQQGRTLFRSSTHGLRRGLTAIPPRKGLGHGLGEGLLDPSVTGGSQTQRLWVFINPTLDNSSSDMILCCSKLSL